MYGVVKKKQSVFGQKVLNFQINFTEFTTINITVWYY